MNWKLPPVRPVPKSDGAQKVMRPCTMCAQYCMEHHCPHAPFDTPAFVPGRSRKPKLKPKSVDTDKVVTDRVKLIARIIFGKDGPEDKLHARMREAFRPMSIKGRLRDQQDEDSCVRQPVSESGPGGRGLAKYLQYGVVGYLSPKKAGSILDVKNHTKGMSVRVYQRLPAMLRRDSLSRQPKCQKEYERVVDYLQLSFPRPGPGKR
jgi:hypothetical protein